MEKVQIGAGKEQKVSGMWRGATYVLSLQESYPTESFVGRMTNIDTQAVVSNARGIHGALRFPSLPKPLPL
jgi:hypothetical protein